MLPFFCLTAVFYKRLYNFCLPFTMPNLENMFWHAKAGKHVLGQPWGSFSYKIVVCHKSFRQL